MQGNDSIVSSRPDNADAWRLSPVFMRVLET